MAIVKRQSPDIVMPVVTADEAVESWNRYIELKKRIVQPEDIQNIQGKDFLKKSYWRKMANFFNISVEIVKEEKEVLAPSPAVRFAYHFTCKATAHNGRYAMGSGSCDNMEKGRPNTIHNTRSTAETRAFNRAVSNLLGGEVSAEEIVAEVQVVDQTDTPAFTNPPNKAVKTEKQQTITGAVTIHCKAQNCNKVLTERELQYSTEYCYVHQKAH